MATKTSSNAAVAATPVRQSNLVSLARSHWPEYLMEAALLGIFMISACLFTILLEHPSSPLHSSIPSQTVRRIIIGIAMGATAIANIYSPWGMRSGAHMNPSVTLAFLKLGRVQRGDAFFYIVAQSLGAVAGVAVVRIALGHLVSHSAVRYAVTVPGHYGSVVAFFAECFISLGMMALVLYCTSRASMQCYTGVLAGILVALYIAIEAPYSGMSMNPARSLGSAVHAGVWSGFWIYLIAPPLAMLSAVQMRQWLGRKPLDGCAKLHHQNSQRCIFCGANGGSHHDRRTI